MTSPVLEGVTGPGAGVGHREGEYLDLCLRGGGAGIVDVLRFLLGRARLWRRVELGRGARVAGRVVAHGGGRIVVGSDAILDARVAPIELHARPGAEIVIGPGTLIEGGVSIEALARVEIGPNARLRGFSKILDSQFHPLTGSRHSTPPPPVPILIGAGCEVGWRAILLPGARLLRGSRVLAMTTVSREVPENAVIGGSPPIIQ